ncbi:hypothetical protein [Streptomyces sp. MBT55]|uniref:hypothetical protein n=1 Tax=Streptomyces sp. MBT55 TaxID=1488386 RepID=UPI001914D602|nr:hypothetical protein [Streptomyces sp. MBT55]MBK6045473.1 hypothetical protein [Streptomyces sp. MBT55]
MAGPSAAVRSGVLWAVCLLLPASAKFARASRPISFATNVYPNKDASRMPT